MFVRYFIELPYPQARVETALLTDAAEWLEPLARGAGARGEGLLAEVGVGSPGRRVGKQVAVRLGQPVTFRSQVSLPLVWEPDGGGRLFPRLEADIEIGQLGAARTQLALSGRYQPPLGLVGRVLDRTLLHRVAEATVKDFLDRVAERLTAILGPGSCGGEAQPPGGVVWRAR
jgi:hypothetical protein